MCYVRFGLLIFLLLGVSIWAQPASSQQVTTPTPAPQDPQAVSVLNQALAVAGGIPAISAISDYVGTGTITYYRPKSEVGSVTVRANWLDQLRIDSVLSGGARSKVIKGGSTSAKTENGAIIAIPGEAPMSPGRMILPHMLLAAALGVPAGPNVPGYKLSYKGIVEIDARPTQDIQVQFVLPGLSDSSYRFVTYHTIDIFIDGLGNLIMTQEDFEESIVRQIRYSDYRPVNGIQVPFSVSETISGLQTWLIQLDKINFNTGLQDSDFQF
jgi:hypothetical protein